MCGSMEGACNFLKKKIGRKVLLLEYTNCSSLFRRNCIDFCGNDHNTDIVGSKIKRYQGILLVSVVTRSCAQVDSDTPATCLCQDILVTSHSWVFALFLGSSKGNTVKIRVSFRMFPSHCRLCIQSQDSSFLPPSIQELFMLLTILNSFRSYLHSWG